MEDDIYDIYKLAQDRLAIIQKRNIEIHVLKKNYCQLLQLNSLIVSEKDEIIKSLEETDRTNYLFFIFCVITGSLFILLDFFK